MSERLAAAAQIALQRQLEGVKMAHDLAYQRLEVTMSRDKLSLLREAIDAFIKRAEELSDEADPGMTPEAEAKYIEYRGRRGKELELWHQWKKAPAAKKPEYLTPLLKSMNPLIKSHASKMMTGLGGSMARAGIENELTNAAMKSIQSYDPSRGTALSTHVVGGFRRISDYVNANRNAKYIPGEDMKRYDTFRNASEELRAELGRDPLAHELKERLPWSLKTIKKMQQSFSRELYTDIGDGVAVTEERPKVEARAAFYMAHPELNDEEKRFGEAFFRPVGEPLPHIKNIAKKLGITPERAYVVKSRVEKKMERHMKGE